MSPTRSMSPPAEGAEQEFQPAPTQAGPPRWLMKWIGSMIEMIMHIYYMVTNLGQNTTGHKQQLEDSFFRKYSQLRVTEQRVADQLRVIIRKRLLRNLDQLYNKRNIM